MSIPMSRVRVGSAEIDAGETVVYAEVKDELGSGGWGGIAVGMRRGELESYRTLSGLLKGMAAAVDAEVAVIEALDQEDLVTIEEDDEEDE
jgi:hypothetical protein